MILQENKYIDNFSGICRDIVYIEKEKVVKLYFHFILNEDLCITFYKKYENSEIAYSEIKKFIEKEGTLIERNKRSSNDDIKDFIIAIKENKIPLPNTDYKLQNDIAYLLEMFT